MRWKKRGLIYCPSRTLEWQKTSTMLPTALIIGDVLRIYTGFCDSNNVGRIGYVDVDPSSPDKILGISQTPSLDIGRNGCFDDNGVVPVSVLRKGSDIYLYYIGFQLGVNVPYYMFCGLAISNDGTVFHRYSQSPILDRFQNEVYARCGVNVIKDENEYRMWYIGSHEGGWVESKDKLKPLYVMKTLKSQDGINWHSDPIQCLDYKNKDEHGFGRPFVWKDANIYKMYYSIRTYSRGYYIGYAESDNGIHWTRLDDQAGISPSNTGWDSENISYPFLFNYEGKTYMLYNGNGMGKTGFGFAELVRD